MLHDLLRAAAAEVAEQPAIISAGRTSTYAAWDARGVAVARGLRERDLERVGCWVQDPADALAVLAGASRAGTEACLYPRALDAAGAGALAERLGHDVVLTDAPADLGAPRAVPLAELETDGPDDVPGAASSPVLVLTTGSTGTPKGTRQRWDRLVRAVRQPDDAPGTRWLLAYNLNQFAGVQLLLHVLVSRATLVAPPSSHARDVLDAMRAERTTHVSATPTFWRLLVAGLDEDAASQIPLRQITLGGEATPGDLLARLHELFPDARITHVYAGTEFGSAVAVGDGLPGLPVSVLDRPADADVRLRVVDGELQVRSRVGMVGYLAGDDADEEHWHPTGDLVEERDGRLHFVGRTSEIINVGGAKVHPLPIEELVRTVDGVADVAVYGRKSPITGQIVALDVVLVDGADDEAVDTAIRAAAEALPAPGRPRRIRFVPALESRGDKRVRRQQEPSA